MGNRQKLIALALLPFMLFCQIPVDNETPRGTIDGTNALFTLAFTPNPISSLHLYLNGLRQQFNSDFFIGENRVHFVVAPQPGDKILADYRH